MIKNRKEGKKGVFSKKIANHWFDISPRNQQFTLELSKDILYIRIFSKNPFTVYFSFILLIDEVVFFSSSLNFNNLWGSLKLLQTILPVMISTLRMEIDICLLAVLNFVLSIISLFLVTTFYSQSSNGSYWDVYIKFNWSAWFVER